MNRETEEVPWQQQEIVVVDGFFSGSVLGGRFTAGTADTLAYVFENVRRSFSYRVVAGDGPKTGDMGGNATTQELGAAIAEALK